MDEQMIRKMLDMLSDIADAFDAYRDGYDENKFWDAWNLMYGYIQDLRKRGIADIPHALKYAIFREIEHEYTLQDARMQVEYWLEARDLDPALADKFDYEKLVQMWERYAACDVPDNTTWEYVVGLYAKDEVVV